MPAKIREKSKKKFAKQNKTNATDKRIWNEYISFVPIDCMSLAFADRLIVDCDDDFVTLFMHKKNLHLRAIVYVRVIFMNDKSRHRFVHNRQWKEFEAGRKTELKRKVKY